MEPIVPRLYSISSSPASHGSNEIHLTVSLSKFKVNEQQRYGLCSQFLSRFTENDSLDFYIHSNNTFRLPSTTEDVIMIGPGTGIAPFRSFLFEREAQNASGKNWLFFGEQYFVSDFLYQSELQTLLEGGTLTKLSLAFSREQHEKIYVQNKMLQHSDELFTWLEKGAYIYVCGAKEPMSSSVEQTLVNIIAAKKNITVAEAQTYLFNIHEEGRYHKDVY